MSMIRSRAKSKTLEVRTCKAFTAAPYSGAKQQRAPTGAPN